MEKESVKVVRLRRLENGSKLKAFADVAIGDFIIKGFRIVEGKNGLFLGMPQEKAKDGKWYSSFSSTSKEAQQDLINTVLEAYEE